MADELGDDDIAPRDGGVRTERAVKAMMDVGLDRALVVKTLKKLYKVFESVDMWNHVEMDGYRMLADEVCNLQARIEAKQARVAADLDIPDRPKRNGNVSQSSSPRVARVHSYEERSATALKVMASENIRKEEDIVRKQMQRDERQNQAASAQKNSSLLHSRGGLTRTDGRGVKLIEHPEARRRPDDSMALTKLKQPREEPESASAPTTSRKHISSSQASKKLKRLREEEECKRELKNLTVDAGGLAHSEHHDVDYDVREKFRHDINDLSRGFELIPIPIVNQSNSKALPSSFFYIDKSRPYEKAFVNLAISRIGDDDCCPSCYKDCLSAPHLCACVRETGGEFGYTIDGCLRQRYINKYSKIKRGDITEKTHYCETGFHCPIERQKNEENPAACKGHFVRDFVKECSSKCGCSKQCGNRVVQRGITRRLEVFMTPEGKGWGIRTLEELPVGAFVFEYVGEILTNSEMWERNSDVQKNGEGLHTYPIVLDADWGSEANLKDEEALGLDATYFGNVARFLNHRCQDANLMDMPVEIESPDRHYYHVAFFTNRRVRAMEELTWDYNIDFEDEAHPVPAFACLCESRYCRGKKMQLSS